MRMLLLSVLLMALSAGCSSRDQPSIIDAAHRSVVSLNIHTSDGTIHTQNAGSAFFVSDDLLVTANHVVTSVESTLAKFPEGHLKTYAVKYSSDGGMVAVLPIAVLQKDPTNDLALLRVDKSYVSDSWKQLKIAPLPLSVDEVQVGSRVALTGFFLTKLGPFTSLGTVGGFNTAEMDNGAVVQNAIYSDITTLAGMSGGPLISLDDGRALGMNIGVITQDGSRARVSIALSARKIVEMVGDYQRGVK